MGTHDHPEACQHTVTLCYHCGEVYCTVCSAQWVQAPLPQLVDVAPVGPGSHQEGHSAALATPVDTESLTGAEARSEARA